MVKIDSGIPTGFLIVEGVLICLKCFVLFQGCLKNVLRVFQGSFKGASRKFEGCIQKVL